MPAAERRPFRAATEVDVPIDAAVALPPPPARIGDCTVVREIGHGSMGVVYEGVQDGLARKVAIKVLAAARAAIRRAAEWTRPAPGVRRSGCCAW